MVVPNSTWDVDAWSVVQVMVADVLVMPALNGERVTECDVTRELFAVESDP